MAACVELEVSSKAGTSTMVLDRTDAILVGRHADCQVRVAGDGQVSRFHFVLAANPPDVSLRDLGSLNGTYVNGKCVGGADSVKATGLSPEIAGVEIMLHDGDRIDVGKASIVIRIVQKCDECGARFRAPTGELGAAPEPAAALCEECRRRNLPQSPDTSSLPPVLPANAKAGEQATGLHAKGDLAAYAPGELIGEGGMGVVYRGVRRADGFPVAIKLLARRHRVSAKSVEFFLREIEVLKQLEHPHIVQFLDGGTKKDGFFLVMDLCPHGNLVALRERLGKKVPLATATSILRQCLEALEFAHGLGIVHRDLTPRNILIAREVSTPFVQIADFGLAKSFSGAGLSGVTATGTIGGTLKFMPREQVTQFKYFQPVSDIWSLAATGYYLLTGRTPLDFPPSRDAIEIVLNEVPIPIRNRKPDVPARVANVFDKALNMDPAQRFQTAREFREAVDHAVR